MDDVRSVQVDKFDNLPVILSADEHELFLRSPQDRINFLQHSYKDLTNDETVPRVMIDDTGAFGTAASERYRATGGTMDEESTPQRIFLALIPRR